MSEPNDTAPAAETENAERAPLSDIFRNDTDRHEAEIEVGSRPAPVAEAAPAADPSAQPAPPAEAAAPPAAVVDPATKPPAEQPFWYRKELKARKEREAELERENQRLRAQGPQRQPSETPEFDPDRPLTQREYEARQEHFALVGRLERSEERFVDKLGEETFESTREWLATRPDIEEWALKQRDPWAAAHSQYTKEKLAAEIGEDPNAWRAAEKERMRQELLAEMGERQPAPAPTTPPTMRSPPPAPASTVRSAAPSRDPSGRFAGPQPISQTFKHRSGG